MARELLDAEKAYGALLAYKADPTDDSVEVAYGLVDETVEIAVRMTFSRCPSKSLLDDLRQAGRLRIFQCLPKMAMICDNPEFYVRLCIQTARRAMLTEYTRLKRQSGREVSLFETRHPSVDEDGAESMHMAEADELSTDAFTIMNQQFDQFERQLLLQQTSVLIYTKAKQSIVEHFRSRAYQEAGVFILLMMFKGHDTSDFWISETWGIKDPKALQQFVTLTLRRVVQENSFE